MGNNKKKNIILVDWIPKENWDFLKGIEETTGEKWEIHACDSSRNNRAGLLNKILHYIKLFSVPFHVILHINTYKQILAFHKIHGLILVMFFKLFRIKSAPRLTVMTFIYKPKTGLKGKIFHAIFNYYVNSDYVKKIVVYSKSEIAYYARLFNVSEEKFFATNYCIEDSTAIIPIGERGDYYLSVGRSNRDYDFLLSNWDKDRKLVILNETLSDTGEHSNIKILNNCHGNDYLRILSDCYAVIIPLEDPNISSGQLVIMQAMMYGKPVIITNNDTVKDYITDGYNGIIIEKNKESLYDAIEKMENDEKYNKISMAGKETFKNKYSLYEFGRKIGQEMIGD